MVKVPLPASPAWRLPSRTRYCCPATALKFRVVWPLQVAAAQATWGKLTQSNPS